MALMVDYASSPLSSHRLPFSDSSERPIQKIRGTDAKESDHTRRAYWQLGLPRD